MPYRYLPDIATADVAFEATGATMEEMFMAAADALTNVMVEDLSSIRRGEEIETTLENNELDMLLFDFLQEFVYQKDVRRLLLRVSSLEIKQDGPTLKLRAVLQGEEIDPGRHPMLVDIKGVTLHRFAVEECDGRWKATVVLDI